jgi:quercetin dioxygenase-like cupin family protein
MLWNSSCLLSRLLICVVGQLAMLSLKLMNAQATLFCILMPYQQRVALSALISVVIGASTAYASTSMPQPPMSILPSDPSLAWGPCPSFMPEGCEIAVLRGDPKMSNADILFRVPGKSVIPNHWHTSAERMVLLQGKMKVTYQGQDPIELKKGTYAYGPAKAKHRAVCTSQKACVLFIAFNEPVDAHLSE